MATMNKNQTVYYGPDSYEYENSGSVDRNETVTALWKEKSGTWCYIEYRVGNTSYKKRGYVLSSAVDIDTTESVATKATTSAPRYVQKVCSTNFGPGTSVYPIADAMFYAMEVSYLGTKDASNQYAFIEYNIKGNVANEIKKRRAWIYANNLATVNPAPPPTGFKTFKEGAYIPTGYPMAGAEVTQGWNDKYTNNKGHLGYDLAGKLELAQPLFPGKVVYTRDKLSSDNGRIVALQHTVNGVTFYSAYCHLASIADGIEKGKDVALGTVLGEVGTSGKKDGQYGRHLHVCVFTTTYTPEEINYLYGYCYKAVGDYHTKTCEEVSGSFISVAKGYYYGQDEALFDRCGKLCFYDPYGVVTSKAEVIKKYHP